jgi:hypothetical protein
LRQPNRLGALLPFDSGENAINPNAGILKISKQISDRYPFTINADQTEIHFTLNQNTGKVRVVGASLHTTIQARWATNLSGGGAALTTG